MRYEKALQVNQKETIKEIQIIHQKMEKELGTGGSCL
jgi:hypothetical protein